MKGQCCRYKYSNNITKYILMRFIIF